MLVNLLCCGVYDYKWYGYISNDSLDRINVGSIKYV